MIPRLRSRPENDRAPAGNSRFEKLGRFKSAFSLVYWMVVLLVLAYAFSPLARAADRPLLVGMALLAATLNLVFLHFLPQRLWNSLGVMVMISVTSAFTLALVQRTGPLDSPVFGIILLIALAASLVLSRIASVGLVAAISLAFLGLVAMQTDLSTTSYLLAGVQLASLWVMTYVGGFLSQELSLTDSDLGHWELEQQIRDARQGAREVFAGSIHDLKNALDEVLERVTFALRVPAAGVFLLDEDKKGLILTSHSGLPSDLSQLVAVQRLSELGAGLASRAALQRKPFVLDDLITDPFVEEFREAILLSGWRSTACLPMVSRGKVVGVLQLFADEMGFFTEARLSTLASLTTELALSVENVSLAEEGRRRRTELAALHGAAKTMSTTQTLKEAVQSALDAIEQLGFSRAKVFLLDDRRRELILQPSTWVPPEEVGMRVLLGQGAIGRLHSPAKSTTEGGNCYLCLPMVVGGSTIGVIHLDSLHEPYWGDARTDLARGFVDYAAPILQNVRYFRQLQQRAIQDELTGLYNRRFLEGHLHKQLAMASRYAQPLAVLMLDIDLFKTINDRFGHDAGDLVLRSFSSSLSQTIRASDVVARWGGEEFVVVLPSTIGHAAKAPRRRSGNRLSNCPSKSRSRGFRESP